MQFLFVKPLCEFLLYHRHFVFAMENKLKKADTLLWCPLLNLYLTTQISLLHGLVLEQHRGFVTGDDTSSL